VEDITVATEKGKKIAYPRPEDVRRFLDVYQRANTASYAERTSYQALLAPCLNENIKGKGYTTVLGQLKRIAKFAVAMRPSGSGEVKHRRLPERDPGIEFLFSRQPGGDGAIQPSPDAMALQKAFEVLMEVYDNLHDSISEEWSGQVRRLEVRGAAGPNFSYHVCPYILSCWKQMPALGESLSLRWSTGNTADLLPKLDAGLLDFVIGYGLKNKWGLRDRRMQVAFTSFQYKSGMILAVHPKESVWVREGNEIVDRNKDYAKELKKAKDKHNPKASPGEDAPAYDKLRPLDLKDLDLGATQLIAVRSWVQPPGWEEFLKNIPTGSARTIQYVDSYEEAVAVSRMRLGASLLPEVYAKRPMQNAFRIEQPDKPDQFTRWIGVYYSTRFPLTHVAYTMLSFFEAYLTHEKHKLSVRNGHPARYGDDGFEDWCKQFQIRDDWPEDMGMKYPLSDRASPEGRDPESAAAIG
jgi:DNA-binding transcriptional LysR family regulator